MHTYQFPRGALTVDVVVFGVTVDITGSSLDVLLIERKADPFKGKLALPGGFVNLKESLDDAAYRELKEETSMRPSYIEQLYTFGDPNRDPRERVVSVAYMALVRRGDHHVHPGSDAKRVEWCRAATLAPSARKSGDRYILRPASQKLAFDHNLIVTKALERLRAKVRYAPIGFDLLPTHFTLGQLQELYETILDKKLDRSNFRKKILSLGILVDTGQKTKVGRATRVYYFDAERYQRAVKTGFNFEI